MVDFVDAEMPQALGPRKRFVSNVTPGDPGSHPTYRRQAAKKTSGHPYLSEGVLSAAMLSASRAPPKN